MQLRAGGALGSVGKFTRTGTVDPMDNDTHQTISPTDQAILDSLPSRRPAAPAPGRGERNQSPPEQGDRGRLYVVRESDEYDFGLFDTMLRQTLERDIHRPAVARAAAIGSAVLRGTTEGKALRHSLGALPIRSGRKRIGVRFTLEGDSFLYVQASARPQKNEEAHFTNATIDAITALRPEMLVCGPVSRIVRRKGQGERIGEAAKDARTLIAPAEASGGLDISDIGCWMIWQALTTNADFEYRSTVSRLSTGVVWRLTRNRWPRGSHGTPLGYQSDDKGNISLRACESATVRRLLELGAQADLTVTDIVEQMDAEGLLFRTSRKGPAPISDWPDPERAIESFFQKVQLYGTGKYELRWTMPDDSITEVLGLTVVPGPDGEAGYLDLTLEFPLPPEGFATPAQLAAVAATRVREGTKRGTRESDFPLTSLLDQRTPTEWLRLIPAEGDRYLLRRMRMPAESTAGAASRFGRWDGELLATIGALELHRSIADAIRALLDGTASSDGGANKRSNDPASVAEQIDLAERLRAGHDASAALARDGSEKSRFLALSAAQSEILEPLYVLRSSFDTERDHSELLEAPAPPLETVDEALEELGRTKGAAQRGLAAAMSDLLHEFTCEPLGQLRVKWSAMIRLRVGGTTLLLGPVSGVVANRKRRGVACIAATEAAESVLSGELSITDLSILLDRTEAKARRLVRENSPLEAAFTSAMLDAPDQLRRIVWLLRAEGDVEAQRTDPGMDPQFLELVRKGWLTQPFSWTHTWVHQRQALASRAVEFVREHGDVDGTIALSDLKSALTLNDSTLYELLRGSYKPIKGGRLLPAVLDQVPDRSPSTVRLKECQHCEENGSRQRIGLVAFTPEIPTGLLCCRCGRSPGSAARVPVWYLDEIKADQTGRSEGRPTSSEQRTIATRSADDDEMVASRAAVQAEEAS